MLSDSFVQLNEGREASQGVIEQTRFLRQAEAVERNTTTSRWSLLSREWVPDWGIKLSLKRRTRLNFTKVGKLPFALL